jgi:hypothetical protein
VGVREIVIGLIAVLVVYLAVLIWRWVRHVGQRRAHKRSLALNVASGPLSEPPPTMAPPRQAPRLHTIVEDDEDDDEPGSIVSLSGSRGGQSEARSSLDAFYTAPQPSRERAAPVFEVPPTPAPVASSFEGTLEIRQLRQLVETLREDNAVVRRELDTLRAEVARLRDELDTRPRTTVNVSPQYGEAVGLARSGYDSAAIAERCGISISEAQLVRALAAAPQDKD